MLDSRNLSHIPNITRLRAFQGSELRQHRIDSDTSEWPTCPPRRPPRVSYALYFRDCRAEFSVNLDSSGATKKISRLLPTLVKLLINMDGIGDRASSLKASGGRSTSRHGIHFALRTFILIREESGKIWRRLLSKLKSKPVSPQRRPLLSHTRSWAASR